MTIKMVGSFVGKTLVAAFAFIMGMISGGLMAGSVATRTGWPMPTLPPANQPVATSTPPHGYPRRWEVS